MRGWIATVLALLLAGCATPRAAAPDATIAAEAARGDPRIAGDVIALNNLAAEQRDGLLIEIDRVVLGRRDSLVERGFAFLTEPAFAGAPVAGQILFKVVNDADRPRAVHLDQAALEINGERIELATYDLPGVSFGQPVSGELPPGHRANGGRWFAVSRSSLSAITAITLHVPVTTHAGRESLTFELDVSDHRFEPVPENRH
jgi:hypothetical protein